MIKKIVKKYSQKKNKELKVGETRETLRERRILRLEGEYERH